MELEEKLNRKSIFSIDNISDEDLLKTFEFVENNFKEIPNIDIKRIQKTFDIGREVIKHYREGRENVVVQAPTGFGKTFLAFYVSEVTRCVNTFVEENKPNFEFGIEKPPYKYDNDNCASYLLTPNKFLQEQYENDVKDFGFDNIKMMKGQSNYICNKFAKPIPERPCLSESLTKLSFNDVVDFQCSNHCTFLKVRLNCIESKTSVLNYNYWLTSMNNVYPMVGDNAPFKPRHLTVFDEAHSLGKIVQDTFSVDFNINKMVNRVLATLPSLQFMFFDEAPKWTPWTFLDLMNAQIYLINEYNKYKDIQASDFESVYVKIGELITEYNKIGLELLSYFKKVVNRISDRHIDFSASDVMKFANDDEKYYLNMVNDFMSNKQELEDYYEIIQHLGKPSIVINVGEIDFKSKPISEFGEPSKFTISFQCANESGLVKRNVLNFTNHSLFMSATFGVIDEWCTQVGIENYGKIDIPQIFNYDKSPIYKVQPMLSLSWKNKKQNLPTMVSNIMKIIDAHKGERGVIHCGTFEIMNAIKAMGNPRVLTHTNSAEKEEIINLLKRSNDSIVCSPSLIEGVDLKDDLARFMIFAKVPYLSLKDELVQRKMKYYPNWYNWITNTQIEQGLGRGVRNMNDYCVSYFMDEGFENFYGRYLPSPYVRERMKDKHIDEIVSK